MIFFVFAAIRGNSRHSREQKNFFFVSFVPLWFPFLECF